MMITINKVTSDSELQACLAIRYEVFVKGQKVPIDEEVDGKDNSSEHYLLTIDSKPVGVARVRYFADYAKIERVGILDSFQSQGLGKKLMRAILTDLQKHTTIHGARLSSQTHAISFYERLGFTVCSEEYLDAGIPHKDMHYEFIAQ